MSKLLTVVVPVHNEATNVEPLVTRLQAVAAGLAGWEMKVLFVDDGSGDGTVTKIRQLRERGIPIGYLRFSRNFGHQAALEAGAAVAEGEVVVTMDGDLQQPPEAIPRMLQAFAEGAEVVQMARTRPQRGQKGFFSRYFYRFFFRLSGVDIVQDAPDFRLMSRRVVEILKGIPEREKFLRGLLPSLGFAQATLLFDEDPRFSGRPAYTFAKSWRLARKAIFDFSTLPLQAVFYAGTILAVASFAYGVANVVKKLVAWQSMVPGFTDLITSVLFLSGCTLAALGVVGRYMITILEHIRGRPTFVIVERAEPRVLQPPPPPAAGRSP
jgi:glycosyltransferase involved in cell wall biosynthesis